MQTVGGGFRLSIWNGWYFTMAVFLSLHRYLTERPKTRAEDQQVHSRWDPHPTPKQCRHLWPTGRISTAPADTFQLRTAPMTALQSRESPFLFPLSMGEFVPSHIVLTALFSTMFIIQRLLSLLPEPRPLWSRTGVSEPRGALCPRLTHGLHVELLHDYGDAFIKVCP